MHQYLNCSYPSRTIYIYNFFTCSTMNQAPILQSDWTNAYIKNESTKIYELQINISLIYNQHFSDSIHQLLVQLSKLSELSLCKLLVLESRICAFHLISYFEKKTMQKYYQVCSRQDNDHQYEEVKPEILLQTCFF